ncbi:hypoxia up-regulated protein 1-like isoform X2 [Gigantopelta aegis]|uniref:hypoxia up-regulated protein 1-like isoform X2 n=1 Tax=Gigantopelta aegis TaxID=1735272 RepID=UPI001B887BBC|nr:hypoxia up-regulated protein 1-like isoform X2 [Gigantopelta aegis]
MASSCRHLMVVSLVLASFLSLSVGLAVMSIDLGAEFMKIAIVKPGVPMEIVLNTESSRKTRTIVAFRDGERQFANEAYNTGIRFPRKAFSYLTHVIGRDFDDPQVQLYKERFPYYDILKDETRGTVLFKIDEETFYSPEELLAMILDSAKEYAEAFAEQPITDVVITVPPYYNQVERKAVLHAAQMVKLNVLQLMSNNAAVALNFGVFRRKNFNSTMQYYMFYDMGATSTVATVVGYQVVKVKEGTRVDTHPQLSIKGVGFDRTFGGLGISMRLRDHLAKAFNAQKKTKTDVFTNERAMAKLLKESDRVKKVLSANNDHYAQVEGLLDEKDFRHKVTREELEELCSDLLTKVTKPMEEALKISEITMGEITDVILMGGATRMPKVQDELMQFVNRQELGKSINTDEAAAMGAVYQAAYLGKGFKVKTFSVKDGTIYPIVVDFEKHRNAEETMDAGRIIRRTLFGRMNPFPQKKVMTFNKHYADFSFTVGYGDLSFLPEQDQKSFKTLTLANVTLKGVEDAYKKHGESSDNKGIKAHFRMDDSGLLHLDKVESVFEKMQDPEEVKKDESAWSKIGSALGGLFGTSNEKKDSVVETDHTPDAEGKKEESTTDKESKEKGTKDKTDSKTSESKTTDSKTSKSESTESKTSESESTESKTSESEKKEEKPTDTPEEKQREKKTEKEKSDEKPADEQTEKTDDKEEKQKDEANKTNERKDKKEKKEKKGKDKKDKKDKKSDAEKKAEKEAKEKEEEEAKKPKIVTIKENITVEIESFDIPGIPKDNMKESRKRLASLKARDQEKKELEAAKNELEAYIFDAQDKFTQKDYVQCSTEEERDVIVKALAAASDWLYEQPDDAKKTAYTDKLKELVTATKDVVIRVREMQERPKALDAMKSMLNHSKVFLATIKNLTTLEDPMFTEVEITTLEKLITNTVDWLKSSKAEQKKLKNHENPKLLVEDIALKIQALDREVKYLVNKAKYYKPKPKPSEKGKSNETVSDGGKDSANKTEEDKKSTNEKSESDKESTNEKPDSDSSTQPPETLDIPPVVPTIPKTDDKKSDETLQIDASETVDQEKSEHSEL